MNLTLDKKCSLLYAGFYLLICPGLVMFASQLLLSGFSSATIALLLSTYGIISIAVKPVAGYFFDRGYCHFVMYLLLGCMIAGTGIFYFSGEKTLITALVYAILSSCSCTILMELCDSWVLKLSSVDSSIDYAKKRSIGSLTYAFMSLFYGLALTHFSVAIAPFVIIGLCLFCAFCAAMLPNVKAEKKEHVSLKESKSIFLNKTFLLFIVFYAIGACVIDLTDSYVGVIILEKGGTTLYTGLYDFLRAIIEFFVMYGCSKLIAKYGTFSVMTFGMIGLFIKSVSAALMPSAFLVVCTCVTQAISFPLLAPSKAQTFKDLIPSEHLAFAVSLSAILGALVTSCVANPLMSVLIPIFGTSIALCLVSFMALVSAIGLFFLRKAH